LHSSHASCEKRDAPSSPLKPRSAWRRWRRQKQKRPLKGSRRLQKVTDKSAILSR
jgi:uncharacterized protein YjiS (DUF1127 family)